MAAQDQSVVIEPPDSSESLALQNRSSEPADGMSEAISAPPVDVPTPLILGLETIAIALQQTLKYAQGMTICKAQCAALHEQADDIHEVTNRRYRHVLSQGSYKDEFTTLGECVGGLRAEIDKINEDLERLLNKPGYHLYVSSSGISDLLGAHCDNLNNYASIISNIAAAGYPTATQEETQLRAQTHGTAIEEDRQSLHVIEKSTSALRERLEKCQHVWALYQSNSRTGSQKEQADEARRLLYSARHNLSASDLVLPIATMNGEIERVGKRPIHDGSRGQIWKGLWLKDYDVALKVYRESTGLLTHHEQMKFDRQIDLLRTMKHPNVLSLLGVCVLGEESSQDSQLYFVLPWLPNSDAPAYLMKNPDVDRMRIIHDIALGLKYLLSIGVIHGDLRGSEVLISANGSAVLWGFRRSDFSGYYPELWYRYPKSHSSLRWMPPEVHNLEELTPSCDIYSFAMTALQLLSNKVPYYKTKAMGKLVVIISGGTKKPIREDYPSKWIDDRLWNLLSQCWKTEPEERVDINRVLTELEAVRRKQYGWDGSVIILEGWSDEGIKLP